MDDDENPQVSPSSELPIAIVDLDALQDDTHDLSSREHIEEDEPEIDHEPSALEDVQREEQNLQQHSQDQEIDPTGEIYTEDGRPLDGFEYSDDKSDHDISFERLIDTSAPIESVKDAASKFGGVALPKAHLIHIAEKSRIRHQVQGSLEKRESELESTLRLIEELKLNLERAQNEESKAKEDSEIVKLQFNMMEGQSVTHDESLVDETVVSELRGVKREMEDLQKAYESLLSDKEVALERAEKACSESGEIEKSVEERELALVCTKELLEAVNVAFHEAEEKRNRVAMDWEMDKVEWDKELRDVKEEMEKLNQEVEAEKELKRKLDSAFDMLADLKSELSSCKEVKSEGDNEDEVEELKVKIEKARDELRRFKDESLALKEELEHERSKLVSVKEKEGMVSENVASLEGELEKIKSKIHAFRLREKEVNDTMVLASREANDARSAAESAHEGLRKVREEAEQARARIHTLEIKLVIAQTEMEIARASEKRAMDAIKKEYDELSKRAQEAEEHQVNVKVADVVDQVEAAKEDEMKTLRKLEEANQELLTRKEVYEHARNKAERENEAKLAVEEEFRKWNEEEFRKWSEETEFDSAWETSEGQDSHAQDSSSGNKESMGSPRDLSTPRGPEQSSSKEVPTELKAAKKKKKKHLHFFPNMYLLFWKKKGSSQPHTP